MQRLFSMFPRGAPGIALVVLRFAVAAALWTGGPLACLSPAGMTLALILVGVPLCLGLLTPAAAVVCAALHVAILACSDLEHDPFRHRRHRERIRACAARAGRLLDRLSPFREARVRGVGRER